MIYDIHTHHLPPVPGEAIFNCYPNGFTAAQMLQVTYFSAGLHPWFLAETTYEEQSRWLDQILKDAKAIAVGEAGLDKRCKTPFSLQEKAFYAQIALSETRQKPLIVHAVKTTSEIIACRKNMHAEQPWIIHGFRGKKELAKNLLDQGFYLSFGFKYQTETIRYVPEDRLMLETDEEQKPIRQLYQQVAELRQTNLSQLTRQLASNINRLFF